MRFSRFRQHMEGIQTTPRPKKATNNQSDKGETNSKGVAKTSSKSDNLKSNKRPAPAEIESPPIKKERGEATEPSSNVNIFVKTEPVPEPALSAVPQAPTMTMTSIAPVQPGLGTQYPFMTVAPSDLTIQRPVAPSLASGFHAPIIKPEPVWSPVKMEPKAERCDIFVKMEPAEGA